MIVFEKAPYSVLVKIPTKNELSNPLKNTYESLPILIKKPSSQI
jgi:hypothetical protein